MNTFEREVKQGERFQFGRNWRSFLATLNAEKIDIAKKSMLNMIGVDNLNEKKVIDIGSGSGLFSLAARQLGAEVLSFDFDPVSIACTKELRAHYYPNDQKWQIKEGSILDKDFLNSLNKFDVVYSWGVLHHTGNIWLAMEHATSLVKENGFFFIAIYNSQGKKSLIWKKIKKFYCSGIIGKIIIFLIFIPIFFLRTLISSVIKRKNLFIEYKRNRGMSIIHDWLDWIGGYPFEVASVEEIFNFCQNKNFILKNIKTTNGWGNNQFVFIKNSIS